MSDDKVYEVNVPVQVTADNEEQAIKLALVDLRDPGMEWTDFVVRRVAGPHERVAHGLCPVCKHYGDDCEGGPDGNDR